MICKFCGNSIEDNSDFCFICGQKVENAEPAFQPAQSNDVFSQAAQAPVAAPAAAEAPVAAPVAPAAAPAFSPVPVEEPTGKKKKAKKQKDASKASKGLKFFTALFLALFLGLAAFMWSTTSIVFLVLIVVYALLDKKAYKKAKAAGYEEKAVAILNSTGIGACIGLALVCLKLFMVAYM
ncbi:MAG: hypothetical protein IJ491_07020 [Clostridia bacterium]|nr:hypothetical protein [Clostridia bacterium]